MNDYSNKVTDDLLLCKGNQIVIFENTKSITIELVIGISQYMPNHHI